MAGEPAVGEHVQVDVAIAAAGTGALRGRRARQGKTRQTGKRREAPLSSIHAITIPHIIYREGLRMRLIAAVMLSVLLGSFLTVAAQPPAQPPAAAQAPPQPMTFFVTSVGGGNGANLGGLAGAHRHCQQLATAGGAGTNGTWRPYLNANAPSGQPAANPREPIGAGPRCNPK